jgi:CIC family chloride channel protein
MGLSLLVGVVSGLGAVAFFVACQFVVHIALDAGVGYRAQAPLGEPPLFAETSRAFHPWLLLLVPAIGGILSGVLVFTVAPEAEGHGTDAAIAAYHNKQGQIRPRVPLVKILSSAITIGTGGSGGREGPIAQIGAGFGSFIGGALRLRPAERRILMAAGMGAGVAAIFRAPLAGGSLPRRCFIVRLISNRRSSSRRVWPASWLTRRLAWCSVGRRSLSCRRKCSTR